MKSRFLGTFALVFSLAPFCVYGQLENLTPADPQEPEILKNSSLSSDNSSQPLQEPTPSSEVSKTEKISPLSHPKEEATLPEEGTSSSPWNTSDFVTLTDGMNRILDSVQLIGSSKKIGKNMIYKIPIPLLSLGIGFLLGNNYNLTSITSPVDTELKPALMGAAAMGGILFVLSHFIEEWLFQWTFQKESQKIASESLKWSHFLSQKAHPHQESLEKKLQTIKDLSQTNKYSTYTSIMNGAAIGTLCSLPSFSLLLILPKNSKIIQALSLTSLTSTLVGGLCGALVQISNHEEKRSSYLPIDTLASKIRNLIESFKQELSQIHLS